MIDQTPFYLGFNLTPGIGPARLARLLHHFETAQHAWTASRSELISSGLDAKSCEALLATRARVDLDAVLERAERSGVQILCIEHPTYPALLRHIPQPPPLLYVRGTLEPADQWAIAVVGTRSPTSYGKEATRRISGDLASAGVTVVSGLALGVDALAHDAALENGGRTLAVLAGGVDAVYPERHQTLAEQIIGSGALISEAPLGTVPAPTNFPPRNRLISGLSRGTLVTEAGAKSGALITVAFALEQGRDVFAIPGPIFSRMSEGTNRIIREGAGLVTGAQDILEAFDWSAAATAQEVQMALPENAVEAALLAQLSYQPQHVDELGRASGMPAYEAASTLALLELKGLIRQVGAMQFVLARESSATYTV